MFDSLIEQFQQRINKFDAALRSLENNKTNKDYDIKKTYARFDEIYKDFLLYTKWASCVNRGYETNINTINSSMQLFKTTFLDMLKLDNIPIDTIIMLGKSAKQHINTISGSLSGMYSNETKAITIMEDGYPKSDILIQKMTPNDGYKYDITNLFLKEIKDTISSIVGDSNKQYNVLLQNYSYLDRFCELKTLNENLRLYATCTNNYAMDLSDRKLLEKLAIGPESNDVISNNAFDFIVTRPIIKIDSAYRSSINKIDIPEHAKSIERSTRYLRQDGYLFLQIPFFGLTQEFCLKARKIGKIIKIMSYDVSYESWHDGIKHIQYYMILFKKTEVTEDEEEATFQQLRELGYNPRDIKDTVSVENEHFPDNYTTVEIRLFSGRYADKSSLMLAVLDSPLYKSSLTKKEYKVGQPPLPFKKGQIGLVLASGKLDGIVDEGEGFKHVIRGKVFKSVVRKTEYKAGQGGALDSFDISDVNNNLTEINIFTGSGEFKRVVVPVTI